jgi:hypothetical protein
LDSCPRTVFDVHSDHLTKLDRTIEMALFPVKRSYAHQTQSKGVIGAPATAIKMPLKLDPSRTQRRITRRAQDVSNIAQLHGTLIEVMIAWGKRGEGRLQTWVEGYQTPVEATGQQFKAHLSYMVQPLIGFETGQVKRRAALEGRPFNV